MVSPETEDSPDPLPPARPLRSRQTGQNSIAPENSLPQLGQMRWGSVLMALTALQSQRQPQHDHARTERCRNRPARPLANCCPVAQAMAYCLILDFQLTFRNKIPAARDPAALVDSHLRSWPTRNDDDGSGS